MHHSTIVEGCEESEHTLSRTQNSKCDLFNCSLPVVCACKSWSLALKVECRGVRELWWGRYLGLKDEKQREVRENRIMRRLIVCTPHQISSGLSY
jgi:hypothetical protein